MKLLLWSLFSLSLLLATINKEACAGEPAKPHPNVVIIVTDDQGFGELGATGNPLVHTPNIDRFASQSVSLTNFHVMPVCSPTRACLMTGRYNYRTGVVDTFLGRSLMDPIVPTLPQLFRVWGYHTGIFGKWHLGDNYPMRAMDRGFVESLVLNGGGLAQPGDTPDPVDERGAYFDATLRHNGAWEKSKGYVSDVITDAAIHYVEEHRASPFFAYLAFNCPHDPHQVPPQYSARYKGKDFSAAAFPKQGHAMAKKNNPDDLANVYGMIDNIDENVGRLLAKLDELKLAENTIVILFSDNGCQQHNGYNAGFRGWKGTPFEGGIHQFCFLRWPGKFKAGARVEQISSVIDLAPTLRDWCGIPMTEMLNFDGRSLARLLRRPDDTPPRPKIFWRQEAAAWPERTLFFQWHRGDVPERYRAFAARSQDWKLVQPLGVPEKWDGKTVFQLFDMKNDPYEMKNVAAEHPDIVAKLKADYDAWFSDVTAGRDYTVPPRIALGTPHENPVLLTRQDWRGPDATWLPTGLGYWEVNVAAEGTYDIKLRFNAPKTDTLANLKCADATETLSIKSGATECVFEKFHLPAGPARVEPKLMQDGASVGVKYVEVKKLD